MVPRKGSSLIRLMAFVAWIEEKSRHLQFLYILSIEACNQAGDTELLARLAFGRYNLLRAVIPNIVHRVRDPHNLC